MNKLFRAGFLLLALLLMSMNLTSLVAAQSPSPSSSGLQISPTRFELSVNPGESRTFKLNVKNVTGGKIIAKPFVNDFESDNESGQPRLIVDPKKHSDRSIQSYVSGLSDIPLDPGQSKDVDIIISVPKDAAPGGYYGAIRYAAVQANAQDTVQDRQVSLTASVAALVLLEVNGNINEGIKITSMNVLHKNKAQTFFTASPDKLAVHLQNTGNGFSQPFGRVTITKGKKEVYSYEFNINSNGERANILPKSERTFTDTIKNAASFGHYTATASLSYKQGGEVISYSKSFWVIPKPIIYVVLIVIALLLAGLGYTMIQRRRGVNVKGKKR